MNTVQVVSHTFNVVRLSPEPLIFGPSLHMTCITYIQTNKIFSSYEKLIISLVLSFFLRFRRSVNKNCILHTQKKYLHTYLKSAM